MRYSIVKIILLISLTKVNGQISPPKKLWDKYYGGAESDYATYLCKTSDKGFAIIGNTKSKDGNITGLKDTFKTYNPNSGDYWLIKTDSDGKLEWQKNYGGGNMDYPTSIAYTADSGFIICGSTRSGDGDVSVNYGGFDIWVIKTDKNGNLQWQKSFGGNKDDFATSIALAKDGGSIILGYTSSDSGLVKYNNAPPDLVVIKINKNGDKEWQKIYGSGGEEYSSNIVAAPDSTYYICAYGWLYKDIVDNPHGDYDGWLTKIDKYGKILWTHAYGGSKKEYLNEVKLTYDTGCIAVGQTFSNDYDIKNNNGFSDAWVIKVDKNGITQWQKTYGSSNDDYAGSVACTPDSGFIVIGGATAQDSDLKNITTNGTWIFKLNKFGKLSWQQDLGKSTTKIKQVIPENNNNYIGAGYTSMGFGKENHGSFDYYIVYMSDTATAIYNETPSTTPLTLYPNPAHSQIFINTNQVLKNATLIITDITGKEVYRQANFNAAAPISTEALAKGFYLVSLSSEEGRWMGKFVKE